MWNDRKPWWSRKSKENQTDHSHHKNWCVIKVAMTYRNDINSWNPIFEYEHKAVAKINAPHRYGHNGKLVAEVEVDNLTRHEAHCVAKGLNFLDGE